MAAGRSTSGRAGRASGRVLRAAVWLLPLVGAGACDVGDPFTATSELPENPGAIVALPGTIGPAGDLVWSADGNQLIVELENGTLAALDIATGRTTTPDGPRDEYAELTAARTGGAVYFLADRQGGSRSAYRLPSTGGAVRLTDRAPVSGPIVPGDGLLVMGAPGDGHAAYIVAPDSLYLFDNAAATRRFVAAGCTRIVAFSPDAGRVLCKRPTQSTFGVFTTADGSLESVSLQPSERESILLRTRWAEPDSIHSLYRTQTRFRVRTVATGSAFSIWLPIFFGGVRETDFLNWSWSATGNRFAFWIHECLRLSRVGACEFGQSVLYAVAFADNAGDPVAVVKGQRGAEQVALSPDGQRIAFVFQGRLHMLMLP